MDKRLEKARQELTHIKGMVAIQLPFSIVAKCIETVLEPLYTLRSYMVVLDIQDSHLFAATLKKAMDSIAAFETELFSDRKLVPNDIKDMGMKDLLDLFCQPQDQGEEVARERNINKTVLKKFEAYGTLLPESEWRNKHKMLKQCHDTLSGLCDTYWKNLNEGVKKQGVLITNEALLNGVPPEWKAAYRKQAQNVCDILRDAKKGKNEWDYLKPAFEQAKITKSNTWLIIPERREVDYLLTVGKNPEFRRMVLAAYHRVGATPPYDNKPVAKKMSRLRHKIATILGYKNYADYITAGEHIRTGVGKHSPLIPMERLLDRTLNPIRPEFDEIKKFAKEHEEAFSEADHSYWMERVAKGLGYDAEALSDYLTVGKVLQGISKIIKETHRLELRENTKSQKRHSDEIVFDLVKKGADGVETTLPNQICFDLFRRPGEKRAMGWAAWMPGRCHVITNFEKNQENIFLTRINLHQVQQLVHEFGHAFEMAKGDVDMRRFENDMEWMEYASTWMEFNLSWGLGRILRHYETDKSPSECLSNGARSYVELLIKRQTMRYAVNGWRDMVFHSGHSDGTELDKQCSDRYKNDEELLSYGYPYSLHQFGHIAFKVPPWPSRYYCYGLGTLLAQETVRGFLHNKIAEEGLLAAIFYTPLNEEEENRHLGPSGHVKRVERAGNGPEMGGR